LGVALHQVRGDGERLLLHAVTGLVQRSRDQHRATAGDAPEPDGDRRRVGQGHDYLIEGNLPEVGGDLRVDRLLYVPHGAGAARDVDHARAVDPNGGALERPRPGALRVAPEAEAEITASSAGLALALPERLQTAHRFHSAGEGAREIT